METRSAPFIVGSFVLATIVGTVLFLLWLADQPLAERDLFAIHFERAASGLARGSEVHFNGIKVGEVTDLQLGPEADSGVIATIAVDRGVPLHADAAVALEFRGLTGVPVVSLSGGSAGSPMLVPAPGEPSLLNAPADAVQDWTQAAREGFQRVDRLLADNAEPLTETIADVRTFAEALSRNADRVDSILGGLERLTGGGDEAATRSYDLRAPTEFAAIDAMPDGQLAVNPPTAILLLDTQRILLQAADGSMSPVRNLQWGDSLPRLVQARVIEGFENAGFLRVGGDAPDVAADYRLLIDLRQFQIVESDEPAAHVAFTARLVTLDGEIVGAQRFASASPLEKPDGGSAALALSAAFLEASSELIVWTLNLLAQGEPPP